jgi:hypothetical protein
MAYGMNQLSAGLQNAGGAGVDPTALDVASSMGDIPGGVASGPGSASAMLADQASGFGEAGLKNIASSAGYAGAPSSAASAAAQALAENAPNAGMFEAAPPAPIVFDKSLASSVPQSFQMPSLSSVGTGTMENLQAAGRGVANLTGFGTGAGQAASAFAAPVTTKGMAALGIGAMGLSALDEQQKYLDEQLAAGNIAQEEYDAGTAKINESRARSEQAMRDNPYKFYAGGDVEFSEGDQVMGYSMGGQPRFLSGGGDGMSDSIKANIEGKQEARLADGEFVIPADVVSHLGNGSSKAGAKQLYSMMDRVREARTGNPKQGKEINPRNYMTA